MRLGKIHKWHGNDSQQPQTFNKHCSSDVSGTSFALYVHKLQENQALCVLAEPRCVYSLGTH